MSSLNTQTLRNQWVTFFLRWVLRLSYWLPITWVRTIGRGLGQIIYYWDGRSRRVTERNIALAYPELSSADQNILVCIPAAFTNLNNLKVDGIYSVNGITRNKDVINKTLGGVFYIENNSCKIFQSNNGKLFNDSLLAIVKSQKTSFFQQIQCIENGKAAKFKDKKLFQRRGIAILKDNSIAIIESTEAITLEVFSNDLVLLNVRQLIYTDMGAWDEGWYRNPVNNIPIKIGKDLSQTAKQSNWIVFRKSQIITCT